MYIRFKYCLTKITQIFTYITVASVVEVFFGNPHNPKCEPHNLHMHQQSHLAMTYTALAVLRMCGDDYSRVAKSAITKAIKSLQLSDGSFSSVAGGSENDMRFVYCATAVSFMINDFSGINQQKAVEYIVQSQSYDNGIAQGPGQESHGGSTYCAVAALSLMGKLDALPHRDGLIRWCVERQSSGFQGRINKDADTCYSFWIGASLAILGAYSLVDFRVIKGFTLSCEQDHGGFSKTPDQHPDPLHTYLSLCGLSIGGEPNLKKINCALGFSEDAAKWFSTATTVVDSNNNTAK